MMSNHKISSEQYKILMQMYLYFLTMMWRRNEALEDIIENQELMQLKIDIPHKKSTLHVGIQIFTKDETWKYYNVYAEREIFSFRRSNSVRRKDSTIT